MEKISKKAENLILHFARNEMLHLGKKKLAKLLYFVDFTNFELHSESITKLNYEKWAYGPVPSNFYEILGRLEENGVISIEKPKEKFIPETITANVDVDYSVFSENEMKVISLITERFKSDTSGTIEAIAKQEPPYKMVNDWESIPYHLAYYRNSFDEMTLD